jgi:hypothetical protein
MCIRTRRPGRRIFLLVMAGLGPATHDLLATEQRKSWVTGPSPVMTQGTMTCPNADNDLRDTDNDPRQL